MKRFLKVSKLVSNEVSKSSYVHYKHKFLLTYSPTYLLTSKAFTMAEILLSLTIIGVVAAITLPSLTGNVNERVWNTQRKALYARFSQALALMPGLNGYGTYAGSNLGSAGSYKVSVTTDTAAEAFLTDGLSKVIKINNICDNTHLADCGIPTTYTNMAGSTISFPKTLSEMNTSFTASANPQNYIDTKAAAFETQNGESIAVFYNPHCQADLGETTTHYVQPKMCVNFIYDLNGNKGPNAAGKDIGFVTALYASDPVIVAPVPLATNTSNGMTGFLQKDIAAVCSNNDSESRLPNKDELAAMFYNRDLLSMTSSGYWSGSRTSTSGWGLNFLNGYRFVANDENSSFIRCIKR